MNGRRIDVVLVKLCSVIIVVMSLQSLTGYVGYYVNSPETDFNLIGSILLSSGIPILIAASIWFFPATIIGDVSNDSNALPAETDISVLAVTLVGLYILLFGIIDLAYYESLRVYENSLGGSGLYDSTSTSPTISAGRASTLIQIFIGLVLLIGRQSIARILRTARGAGVDNS